MTDVERMKRKIFEFYKANSDWSLPKRVKTTPEMLATYERVDKTVRPVLTRYAHLVQQSNRVLPIDSTKFETLAAELEPIKLCDCLSLNRHARMLQGAMHVVIRRDDYEASELAWRIYLSLEATKERVRC